MRLATLSTPRGPRAALLQGDHYIDLHETDYMLSSSVRTLLEWGPEVWRRVQAAPSSPDVVRYPVGEVRLLPPVIDPPKILCIGLNYRDHAAETGPQLPSPPILFSK